MMSKSRFTLSKKVIVPPSPVHFLKFSKGGLLGNMDGSGCCLFNVFVTKFLTRPHSKLKFASLHFGDMDVKLFSDVGLLSIRS